MNTVDISSLGNLAPVNPIDLSVIPEQPKKEFVFPKAGRYTVKAPLITAEAFTKSQSDNLLARVDPSIVGPSNEGFEIRFTRISAKDYQDPRTNLTTSQVAQYLQAFGITEELKDNGQIANLIASTSGQDAEIYGNWLVEHRPTNFKLKGMKNFPPDGKGGYQSWVEHPDENVLGEDGQRLRLRANFVVTQWLPKVK